MYDAVNFEVALEMANACTYDDLPKFARDHFEYANRMSFAMPDGRKRKGMYGGDSSRETAAPAPSEERLQWLIKELHEI